MKTWMVMNCERIVHGPVQAVNGGVQQELRLFLGNDLVATILVTFAPAEAQQFLAGRALDGMPPVRNDSIVSDVGDGQQVAA